jgi:lysophospholipase L1-like esterase
MLKALLLSAVLILGCSAAQTGNQNDYWVGTWSTSQQLTEPRNNPPEPGLSGNTLRQVVRVSIGGTKLRLSFSNMFGTEPVVINAVHIAQSVSGSEIVPETNQQLTFGGESSLTIPVGTDTLSDSFDFELEALSNVAITIYFDSVGVDVTGHPGSRSTSYILTGDHTADTEFTDAVTTDHWYIIDRIDVVADENTVAVAPFGDSITDGRGSGTNLQNRWPDELSRRFQANASTQNVAVLNQGIGGNCVLRPCLGPAGLERFERDVIDQPGIKYLIVLHGINDIGGVRNEEAVERVSSALIEGYREIIRKSHEAGILAYGATLLPFGNSFYANEYSLRAADIVNEWIRTSGEFDAVIDLNAALTDPDNPGQMLPDSHDGDFLHPSQAGHRMMAEAVDLSLFEMD